MVERPIVVPSLATASYQQQDVSSQEWVIGMYGQKWHGSEFAYIVFQQVEAVSSPRTVPLIATAADSTSNWSTRSSSMFSLSFSPFVVLHETWFYSDRFRPQNNVSDSRPVHNRLIWFACTQLST
jgi:hypothetical protein